MSNLTRAMMMGAAGAGGAGEYVDDLFSTYLHEGVNSSSTINNGIDLSGEGGLVWVKSRTQTYNNWAFDTERGVTKQISFSLDHSEATEAKSVTAFNSNGFDIGGSGGDCGYNCSGQSFVYWTFRKCPGFFDIITYTGNGNASGRTLSHSLGSAPGSIWIKRYTPTSSGEDWVCYHRSVGTAGQVRINKTISYPTSSPAFANVTATSFDLIDADAGTNANNETYVAYIFAHDDQSFGDAGNESIIKCGSYTGTGSNTTANKITLGFEPQWLLIKNIDDNATDWMILDTMRGANYTTGRHLRANLNAIEYSNTDLRIDLHADGFSVYSNNTSINGVNGNDFIYIAIRRPHKPPSAGTEVFKPELLASLTQTSTPGFAPDFVLQRPVRNTSDNSFFVASRLTGNGKYLATFNSSAEGSFASWEFDAPTGKFKQTLTTGSTSGGIQHFFKRAPGFFDVVAYSGSSSAQSIAHNLGSQPGFIIVKCISHVRDWRAYHQSSGATKYFVFNDDTWALAATTIWNDTEPTSTHFTVGTSTSTNGSGRDFIAYLFATRPGVSKVGSYTGTGNNINVDCGFSAGARFVLIKRFDVDSFGDWYVWDSARGIVAGNDPYVLVNSAAAEVTNTDYIDPLNAGFTVTSSAPAALNTSSGTYIFLAIA